jgi:glycerophosphoryl diester phosphodiesterase
VGGTAPDRPGWFTEDFTLAELKTLRAKERIPDVRPKNTDDNGRFEVPTLDEVLDLRARLSTEPGRPVGIAPETKHPSHFASIGLPLEPPMLAALRKAGLVTPESGDAAPDQPSDLVRKAHADGLLVVPFTFRSENQFLGEDYQVGTDPDSPGRAEEEQKAFLAAGVDGAFTDQSDVTEWARTAALGR